LIFRKHLPKERIFQTAPNSNIPKINSILAGMKIISIFLGLIKKVKSETDIFLLNMGEKARLEKGLERGEVSPLLADSFFLFFLVVLLRGIEKKVLGEKGKSGNQGRDHGVGDDRRHKKGILILDQKCARESMEGTINLLQKSSFLL